MQSSRVGKITKTYGFYLYTNLSNKPSFLNLSITGSAKANVFPEPVRSLPIKSLFL